ncbi:MAG: O-phosphoserine--tRNA ligase [Candidatus Odinarchaeia archaeon]
MVKFNVDEILNKASKDYEEAWVQTASLISKKGKGFKLIKNGVSQPVMDFIQKIRTAFLKLGFEEVILPTIVSEDEVYREYGPEASIILDRVFYLAGLPRADIGLSEKKKRQISEIIHGFNKFDSLQEILRRYKKGEIEADDLIENLVVELDIPEEKASKIIDQVFLEFKNLKPVPTNLTRRSHMTALWFPVLKEIYKKYSLPIQLFTIGEKYRREQSLDATHLYSSYTASCVIVNESMGVDNGIKVAKLILKELGFNKVRFEIKKATSKYYAPKSEFEIFIFHPERNEWVEVGNGGFYSPVSLAKYDIDTPVFNIGFGIERFVMILENEEDIRKLVYPYYYKETTYTDEEIAKAIYLLESPQTKLGKEIERKLYKAALQHKDDLSPVEITVFEGKVDGKKLKVTLWERDKNVKLLGPAALNEIWVRDGNIIGILPDKELIENGKPTGITYLQAVSAYAAAKIEEMLKKDEKEFTIRVKISKQPSDINIGVPKNIRRFIMSNKRKIDIRGPVFIGITAIVE